MGENEELRDHMRQTEKDTIDVVSFLKKQDLEKDAEVSSDSIFNLQNLNVFFWVFNRSRSFSKRSKT